ncbi:hypothetical protein STEG23_035259 [Scotinomys teguina]
MSISLVRPGSLRFSAVSLTQIHKMQEFLYHQGIYQYFKGNETLSDRSDIKISYEKVKNIGYKVSVILRLCIYKPFLIIANCSMAKTEASVLAADSSLAFHHGGGIQESQAYPANSVVHAATRVVVPDKPPILNGPTSTYNMPARSNSVSTEDIPRWKGNKEWCLVVDLCICFHQLLDEGPMMTLGYSM